MSYSLLFPFCVWPRQKKVKTEYFPKERLGNQQYEFIPMIGHRNYNYNPATLYLIKFDETSPSKPLFLSKPKIKSIYKHSH